MKLSQLDMLTADAEVAFVITDTDKDNHDVDIYIDMAEEGFNLAMGSQQ